MSNDGKAPIIQCGKIRYWIRQGTRRRIPMTIPRFQRRPPTCNLRRFVGATGTAPRWVHSRGPGGRGDASGEPDQLEGSDLGAVWMARPRSPRSSDPGDRGWSSAWLAFACHKVLFRFEIQDAVDLDELERFGRSVIWEDR